MTDSKQLQQRMGRVGDLVRQFEAAGDPALRSAAKELVQLLMELHGSCLERMLEIAFQSSEGPRLIDNLAGDPLVSSLLVLYGLHPDDLPARVSKAVDRIGPQLKKHDCEVTILAIEGESVRLRLTPGAHSCGSTANSMRAIVEQAVYEAAPDVTSLEVEGAEGRSASGFVSIDSLMGASNSTAALIALESGD